MRIAEAWLRLVLRIFVTIPESAPVLAALARSALEDPDEYVRDSAYQSLLFVNGLPEEQRQRIFQNPPHVDPVRVKAILSGIAG
jgi:hypothetical protein